MSIPEPAVPDDPRFRSIRDHGRSGATWLVLASSGPAAGLGADASGRRVRVIADPRRFRDLLLAERPRIVVCSEPPADRDLLGLVAAERRRRNGMRAIHLAPPDAVDARLSALAAGFDDSLTTSTPALELVDRLGWLDAKARTRPGIGGLLPIAEGLELDVAAHELRRGSEIVHLRPKEYGLLALLAAHPGRAYSRQALLDRVWGLDHSGSMRTVDVHVRWLRSKIEPEPDRPVHLVTVRGTGYRLDPPGR